MGLQHIAWLKGALVLNVASSGGGGGVPAVNNSRGIVGMVVLVVLVVAAALAWCTVEPPAGMFHCCGPHVIRHTALWLV
jgi:hypothetical protein